MIGKQALVDPVILAPMSGVTDQVFRRIVKRFGAGLVVSEMIASQAMIRQMQQSVKESRK
ncbi:MAG TPA: tRNA dihydrouridine synthase DusB, partial [Kiloniellaceae bacterium]|nr:tRNA dihydrouridine synthase DusB [Kiloniellaceae bacterium]